MSERVGASYFSESVAGLATKFAAGASRTTITERATHLLTDLVERRDRVVAQLEAIEQLAEGPARLREARNA